MRIAEPLGCQLSTTRAIREANFGREKRHSAKANYLPGKTNFRQVTGREERE